MPNQKITEMTQVTSLDGTEDVPIIKSSNNRRIKTNLLWLNHGTTILSGNVLIDGGEDYQLNFGSPTPLNSFSVIASGTISMESDGGQGIIQISDEIIFASGGNIRFVIEPDGSWNIGGSNGDSGAVLTSNGSGLPPTWQSPVATSGTYTPTLTNGSNVTSSAATVCQYMRAGNVITVSGNVQIVTTSSGAETQLRMSLPVTSNLGFTFQLAGVGHSDDTTSANSQSCLILGDSTSNVALFRFFSTVGTSRVFYFTFTYLVI